MVPDSMVGASCVLCDPSLGSLLGVIERWPLPRPAWAIGFRLAPQPSLLWYAKAAIYAAQGGWDVAMAREAMQRVREEARRAEDRADPAAGFRLAPAELWYEWAVTCAAFGEWETDLAPGVRLRSWQGE